MGTCEVNSAALSYAPVSDGRRPDMSAARDGAQSGLLQVASNTTPRSAKASMFGVRATRLP